MTLRGRKILIAVTTAVLVAGVAVAAAIGLSGGGSDDGTVASPQSGDTQTESEPDTQGEQEQEMTPNARSQIVLSEVKGGQEAIDALGEDISIVAERNSKTVDEVRTLLLRDETARVGRTGHIFYAESMTRPTPTD